MTLKSILTSFILPPGIFIIILIFTAIWFFYRQKKDAACIKLIIGLVMWLFSISPFSNTLLNWLESDYEVSSTPHGDVIILLEERTYPHLPDISYTVRASEIMFSRIYTAAKLQARLKIPLIVACGAKKNADTSPAIIIKQHLINFGVYPEKIIIDERSRNTYENAKYTREVCEKRGFKIPILVTSAYHLKRSSLSFKKAGMRVIPYPANFLSWENREYSWKSFLPKYNNFRNTAIALKEFLGLLFYHFYY